MWILITCTLELENFKRHLEELWRFQDSPYTRNFWSLLPLELYIFYFLKSRSFSLPLPSSLCVCVCAKIFKILRPWVLKILKTLNPWRSLVIELSQKFVSTISFVVLSWLLGINVTIESLAVMKDFPDRGACFKENSPIRNSANSTSDTFVRLVSLKIICHNMLYLYPIQ